jgi:hypothetical protein
MRRLNIIKKVEALLSSAQDYSAIITAAWRHIQQQRGLQKNREMGNKTIPF